MTETTEQIDQEVAEIEERIAEAHESAREAHRRLGEIEERQRKLAPAVFGGDEGARSELVELEAESAVLERSRRVASDALEDFERELQEAKQRLEEARKDVHRRRARELNAQADALRTKRDELAEQLAQVLDELSSLDHAVTQEIRSYGPEESNRRASNAPGANRRWLKDAFARWLR